MLGQGMGNAAGLGRPDGAGDAGAGDAGGGAIGLGGTLWIGLPIAPGAHHPIGRWDGGRQSAIDLSQVDRV